MKNRIHNAWDLIDDRELAERVAAQERAKARACMDMMSSSGVSLRVLGLPHPAQEGTLLHVLVLYVGDIPAMNVASGRGRMD